MATMTAPVTPSLRTSIPHITSLYEVIGALQDHTGPDNDDLVVATVMSLLQSGQLTLSHQARQRCRAYSAQYDR
jgi:hypothetical protein